MQQIKQQSISNFILFLIGFAILLYITSRAIIIDITHDEAYSFYNVKHFWYVEALCTGNTHWFNFLAIKLAVLFGFEKVGQLRWFSIFSASVFFIMVYFWIRSISNIYIKIAAFSSIVLNPYLIDYFSLARGYSSGLMFEALSLVCFCSYIYHHKQKFQRLSLLFAGMSALANFNFFYFFVAFSILYFYHIYFKNGFNFLKNKMFYFELLFVIGITVLVLKALLFITLCSNDIAMYGEYDFVTSIFYGMIDTFICQDFMINNEIKKTLCYILFGLVLLGSINGILTLKKHKNWWYYLASYIILIMFILLIINKLCFNVLYPNYRTTLMFYPLISLVCIGFINSLFTNTKIKVLLSLSFSIVVILNLVMCVNFNKTIDYYQQQDSKACFNFLDKIKAKKVGVDGNLFGVYRNYYQQTEQNKFLFIGEIINTHVPLRLNFNANKISEYDYLVLFPPYNMSFYKNRIKKLLCEKYYFHSGTLVVKVVKL